MRDILSFLNISKNLTIRRADNSLSPEEISFLPAILEIQEQPPSPLARVVLWLICLIVSTAVLYSCLVSIDIYSSAPGKIIPEGRVKMLQSADTASITAMHMVEGQHVIKGALLAELDPVVNTVEVKSTAEKQSVLRLEIARLNSELNGGDFMSDIKSISPEQISLQEALRSARTADHAAKISEARNNLQSKAMALTIAEDNLKKTELLVRSIREREEKTRPYVGTIIPRFDYLRIKDELTQNESQIITQQTMVKDATEQQLAASQRLSQINEERRMSILSEVAEKKRSLVSLDADAERYAKLLDQRQLRSPVDGIIQTINFNSVGAVVGAGQTIATIIPTGADLVVEGTVSNTDIGYIKVGQEVRLKIDTFPSQLYGSISGVVTQISDDSEDRSVGPQENLEQSQGKSNLQTKAGLFYKIKIRPNALKLEKNGKIYPLKVGMTLQADIKTDNRKIMAFFIAPLIRSLESGLKDR